MYDSSLNKELLSLVQSMKALRIERRHLDTSFKGNLRGHNFPPNSASFSMTYMSVVVAVNTIWILWSLYTP
jgi:hypothetical protein